MDQIILCSLLGSLGGIARMLIDLGKAKILKRKIHWKHWLITVGISGIIGTFMGVIFSFDYLLAPLAGYAGLDILDGIYKTFHSQKVIVNSG